MDECAPLARRLSSTDHLHQFADPLHVLVVVLGDSPRSTEVCLHQPRKPPAAVILYYIDAHCVRFGLEPT